MQIKKMVSLSSRTGRHLQKYNQGCRQVVGCIPYRFRKNNQSPSLHGTLIDDLEVLLISSQKSPRMMFPKGGWEIDETMEDAALRETMEEAGVLGIVGENLGRWCYESKSQSTYHEAYMFSFRVTEELDVWPEKNVRQRIWITANEARELCTQTWMKEALDAFVCRLMNLQRKEEEPLTTCSLEFLRKDESVMAQTGEEDLMIV